MFHKLNIFDIQSHISNPFMCQKTKSSDIRFKILSLEIGGRLVQNSL
jgi:hypothetical protein